MAQQGAGFERAHAVVRFDAASAAMDKPIHDEQAGELRRLKIQLRIAEEERRLPRRLAAMAQGRARILLQHVTSIQLAYAIVAQAGPLADGKCARLMTDQAQRKIEFLTISRVAVIGYSHGRLPLQITHFPVKNNLTEINHKASLVAKRFSSVLPLPLRRNTRSFRSHRQTNARRQACSSVTGCRSPRLFRTSHLDPRTEPPLSRSGELRAGRARIERPSLAAVLLAACGGGGLSVRAVRPALSRRYILARTPGGCLENRG